jgi:hypothetical protein
MTADDDRPWRWAFRRGCGRSPRGDELTRYQYWHGISRRDGFAAAGPMANVAVAVDSDRGNWTQRDEKCDDKPRRNRTNPRTNRANRAGKNTAASFGGSRTETRGAQAAEPGIAAGAEARTRSVAARAQRRTAARRPGRGRRRSCGDPGTLAARSHRRARSPDSARTVVAAGVMAAQQ